MRCAIEVHLSEISCVTTQADQETDRLLFAFAAKAGPHQAAVILAPRWTAGGTALDFRPDQTLLRAEAADSRVGIAIFGFALGRSDAWEESKLARQLAEARIGAALDLSPGAIEPGCPWDDGLEAVREGIKALAPDGPGEILFDFSKAYSAPAQPEAHCLFHTMPERGGSPGARFKVVLRIEGRMNARPDRRPG